MTTNHVSERLLNTYAAGGTGIEVDVLWAVESHLESCAQCRDVLGRAIGADTTALVDRVHITLDSQVSHGRQMPVRRRMLKRAAPALLPRLGMTVLVVLIALGLDLANKRATGPYPSLVLLLAPVAPLLGVAAAWSRGLDPGYELVVASSRAGLYLVVRRTLAVLLVVIPVLAGAGALVGTSPARWLVPSLAFTIGALALGEVVGLHRAATGLIAVWVAAVVAPSLITLTPTVLLEPASLPVWAGLTTVITVVLIQRRDAYTGLPSGR